MHRMTSHSILLNCLVIMFELLDADNSKFTAYGYVHIAIELWCTRNTDNLLAVCKMKPCKKMVCSLVLVENHMEGCNPNMETTKKNYEIEFHVLGKSWILFWTKFEFLNELFYVLSW